MVGSVVCLCVCECCCRYWLLSRSRSGLVGRRGGRTFGQSACACELESETGRLMGEMRIQQEDPSDGKGGELQKRGRADQIKSNQIKSDQTQRARQPGSRSPVPGERVKPSPPARCPVPVAPGTRPRPDPLPEADPQRAAFKSWDPAIRA